LFIKVVNTRGFVIIDRQQQKMLPLPHSLYRTKNDNVFLSLFGLLCMSRKTQFINLANEEVIKVVGNIRGFFDE
jgi:hypothetical protein